MMSKAISKEDAIIKTAEELVRRGGYNGFSFRDIAKIVGVKSASVHYHFPTKEDLGAAVARHYTERFLNTLGDPADLIAVGKKPIEVYVAAFRHALVEDKLMCLCGMLGAEIEGLPSAVVKETQAFFDQNITWLKRAYSSEYEPSIAARKAIQALALLEGAMIASNVKGDIELFDNAAELLIT
jgi:TetR/AcrR family transcriptional repressor of nem operon